jgi:glycosyltransferase involved in cell wall biosynthesis
MRKVLHLITGLEKGGGAEAMLLKTLPYLKSSEQAVAVLRGEGEIGKRLEEKGIKVYYLKMKNYLDIGVLGRYRKVIQDYNPDIQVNYLIHADIFGRVFAKKYGVRKLVTYIRNRHSNFPYAFLDRITLKKVDYLLTNSKANLEYYRKKYGFDKDRSGFITNGVYISDEFNDVDKLKKLREELNIDKEDFVISSVARLHKQKSLDTLIKALNILNQKNISFKAIICGSGKEESNLKVLVHKLQLDKQVIFLKNRDDILDILKVSNVFVLPSIKEGMSNALLEAMSIGLPAMVSDIEENKELIEDKENGYVFKLFDYNDLADKLETIKEQRKEREVMSERNIEKIKSYYDIRVVRRELDEFLSDV